MSGRGVAIRVGSALASAAVPAALLWGAPVSAGDPPGAASVRVEEVTYWSDGALRLDADVYRPADPTPAPAVLTVHSGAWTRGDRARMARVARRLAESGYVAVNIDYRLAPEHRYPAALEDCRAAVRWMRRHADRHGIDDARIGALGYSAGGHLVALLATRSGSDTAGAADAGPGSARIQAAVIGGAPTDLRRLPPNLAVPRFLGGTPDEIPEIYTEASPIHHVRPGLPPIFVYHGRNDWIVDDSHGRRFAEALARSGVPHEYVEMPLGHVATYAISGDAFDAVVAFLDRWLRAPGGRAGQDGAAQTGSDGIPK